MTVDALVIGAGHNGLACAAYLARAGQRVLVLEERDIVGGFCTTEETMPGAPGYRFCPTSLDVSTGNIPPSVFDELGLERHGLKWLWPDPFYSYIAPDGSSLAFWRDHRRTCAEISRFSSGDAERYASLIEMMRDFWIVLAPYMMGHPRRPGLPTWWAMLTRAFTRTRHLSRAVRVLLSAPGPVLDEWFESPQLKAALACFSAGGVVPIDEPLSGLIMSIMALQHQWGVRRPVGGVGEITRALAAEVKAHGGEVRTGARVARLTESAGRVQGVVTSAGEAFGARTVIGAIDPLTLFRQLMPAHLLPSKVAQELGALGVYRNNFASFRGDVATDRPLSLIVGVERSRELRPSCMLFAPDVPMVRRAGNDVFAGRIAAEMPYWVAAPSAIDRTLVPAGSAGEALYVFLPTVPFKLAPGDAWAARKDDVLRRVMADFEHYAPGIGSATVASLARSPDDLTAFSRVHLGHLFHADMSAAQMGPWRPTPSLAGYRSPVPGLWHTGAGAHPMGTLCGWPGRAAARHLLAVGA
jgi:beta-carotene ketolase (CrtO type)